MIKIQVEREIEESELKDLLTCALEGGSNYWYSITEFGNPSNVKVEYRHIDLPFLDDGYLMIEDTTDGKIHRLDKEKIITGIKTMAEKFPKAFALFVDESYDAYTGDTFLQCCLFGDEIYS